MDKTLFNIESSDMASQTCALCNKKGRLELEGKKYCTGHYSNELKKFRDELIIKLITSLEGMIRDNPKLLNDVDRKLLLTLKSTYRSNRFAPENTLSSQLENMNKDDLIALLSKALSKKPTK